ncbi:hypothetical protein [Chryseobacterium sp.]|uniref:hypothetical protein n=1 Tax=Chryseobacterium sp. TaxID=1871047 RepID=UPI003342E283
MKFKLFILFFTFSIVRILATGQQPDRIIINNKEYNLLNTPLERYFKDHPDDHPIYGSKSIRKKDGKEETIFIGSTSNYRGYIATFKIENNTLSVIDIKIQNVNSEEHEYISVFKKTLGDRKIDLNYSGILVIPIGRMLKAADFGYASLYDKYHLLTIQQDNVVKEKELNKDDFMRFKVRQFVDYKKTEDYKTEVKNYFKDWNTSKEWDLLRKNTRRMSKKEIARLKKQYECPPDEDYIDNYLFVVLNLDFVITDY